MVCDGPHNGRLSPASGAKCPRTGRGQNAALVRIRIQVKKSKPLSADAEKGQKGFYPPRLKITLTVVSTSTGSLLSR